MPNNNNSNNSNNRGKGLKNTCCPETNPVNTSIMNNNNRNINNNNNNNNNQNLENGSGGRTKRVRFNNTPLYGSTQITPEKPLYYSQQGMPGTPSKNYQSIPETSGAISSSVSAPKVVGATNNTALPSYNNVVSQSKIKSSNNTNRNNMNNGNNNGRNNNNGNNSNNKKLGLKDKAKKALDKARRALLGETGKQILIIILVAILTFILMYFIRKWLLDSRDSKKYAPYLIEGSKSGKSSLVVSTNPNEEGSVPLYRSHNQDGAEYTYSFWMLVDSMEYNYGKWKHVFHRGNKTSFPNRAPGVWLHPETNTLRVYMNTFEDPLHYVDVENLPVKKWFHVAIVLNHKYLDIYFNGKLRHRKELKSAPRQNYGPFWAGLFGGFEGYLSKVRYFNKALEYNEIEKIVKDGPSRDACGDTGDYPPYLDDAWWFDMKV